MDNSLNTEFNIDTYTKTGFDLVVELDDEVEYLINKDSIQTIKSNAATVSLKRLIDGEIKIIAIERIIKSLQTRGPVDYLTTK